MSVAATTAPSPGWYPDPQDHGQLRWWDGGGWSAHVREAPRDEPVPRPEPRHEDVVSFVADIAVEEMVTDDYLDDGDPIEFSWGDTTESFVLTAPEPGPEPELVLDPEVDEGPFSFRVRTLAAEARAAAAPVPAPPRAIAVYESPLATIFSPLPTGADPLEPESHPDPEPGTAVEALPPPPVRRRPVPRRALTGSAGLVVLAAAAAGVTNLLGGDEPDRRPAAPAAALISTADRTCLKEWNTTASGSAADLRVTLGQFTGAYARVARVDPLPGTLMAPDSCALTMYDPTTDTNAVFVSGVEENIGYLDVTSYPRALDYGWPKSANDANVAIRADGTIAAI